MAVHLPSAHGLRAHLLARERESQGGMRQRPLGTCMGSRGGPGGG